VDELLLAKTRDPRSSELLDGMCVYSMPFGWCQTVPRDTPRQDLVAGISDEVKERVVDVDDVRVVEVDNNDAYDPGLAEARESRRRLLGGISRHSFCGVGPGVSDGERRVVGERLRHVLIALVEGRRVPVKAKQREGTDRLAPQTEDDHKHAVDSDRLVDLRDLGRDRRPELGQVETRKEERLSRVDEMPTPGVLGDVAGSRHERAEAGGCIDVRDAGLKRKMESNRREPAPIREQANDAAIRDDIHDRSGDHVEQALVVRRRFGERPQGCGQNMEPVVKTRVSLCAPHNGYDRT
jgi:hypothetical protein